MDSRQIVFNEALHEYSVDGQIIPSVTQIIPKPDFKCTAEQLEAARIEGKQNHALVESYFEHKDTFGEPYLIIFDRFVKENKILLGDFWSNEIPLHSEKYKYAGTPDIIFTNSIVDLKRSFGSSNYHGLQLAGYNILAEENEIIPDVQRHIILTIDVSKDKYNLKNVWNPYAKDIFLKLVQKFYIEKNYNNYMEL